MADSSTPPSSSSSLVSVNSSSSFPFFKCTFLDKDTDLNEIPVWNNDIRILLSYWLQQRANHDDIFGSFRSANAHIDSLGEVDVISDAEHIKKLLKVPFNKHSQISMIVHRLGRTILLDEFDVHSHLLRLEKNDWTWFRDFFLDTVLRNISVKHFYKKNKTRDELIRKDRLVKFLCQSVELPESTRSNSDNNESQPTSSRNEITAAALLQQIKDIVNANNDVEDNTNHTNYTSSPFQRTVNWTFENMKMLIGSDLPIFGDEQHPAVSLRLRDMNKPINVLTGIDCWLDNLMCNVPELAMCYHVDGIVQSYEIVKTEDIPYREGCEFHPNVIRDLATNLLSFLKANATKEGHTYWLFKGPDDDIVKLYDLTSLCETNRDDNPYTLPVATLFYKMALNMVSKSDHETRSKESGTIRTLLKHCLDMLNPEKFPEYHCAAAYMMSDLYIDDNVSEQSWTSDESDIEDPDPLEDDLPYEQDNDSHLYTCVDIKTLGQQQQQNRYRKTPDVERLRPIHGNLDRRATEALKYLVEALRSNTIHRRTQAANTSTTNSDPANEQENSSTNKDQKSKVIVPLPYKATRQSSKILIDNKNHLTNDERLKAIILHKAAAAYFCLVDRNEKEKNYGSCLRYLRLALNCYSAEAKLQSVDHNNSTTECKKLLSYIMSIAGDCRLMIAHITSAEEIEKYREQYQTMNEVDLEINKIIVEVGIDANLSEFAWVSELTPVIDRNLFASVHAYEYAINIVRNLGDHEKKRLQLLTKRFGNVRNEMGVYWMNKCAQAVKHLDREAAKETKDQFRKSFESFDAGIQAFERINDISNIALLHSNLGRLMRYYAQFYAPVVNGVRQEFSQQERQSYQKAFDYYLRGLKLVENRLDLIEVYRTLSWELSNSYFTMATSLQDYAPLSTMSQDDIEKEVIDCMTRALKYLDVELNTPSSDRYSNAKYRAATIHHRLASLLHNTFRSQNNATRRKRLRALASLHYQKALELFSPHDNPLEYLRLLIEEVALTDFELQNATDNSSRLKYSQQGLRASFQCQECIGIIEKHRISSDPDDYTEVFAQESQRLLSILNGRIQAFLKELVKIYKTTIKNKSIYEDYKEMYSISLRIDDKAKTFSKDFYDAIERLKKIYEKNTSD
ncbi:unnamed protein product [Adineta steineri]|uniref:Erythroid differentiation-related factor 1 n=2 Tax=Adineta steineri TaxID=433720 RepID=A0A815FJJ4_9BILA|nr:unnamed protein product [Adineta steineri]CAF1587948.1 unnamed protein product [Adineta steineri]